MSMDRSNNIRSTFASIGVLMLMLPFQNCSEVEFTESRDIGSFKIPLEGCTEDSFSQPAFTFGQKVDLLIMSDTSVSIDAERRAVAEQIDRFINELPQGADYQVGVMLGHMKPASGQPDWVGRLYQAKSEPKILASVSMDQITIRQHLLTKLTNTVTDAYGGTGGESGMFSLTTAITSRLQENKKEGFFRANAALAVIFVSDENDVCMIQPDTTGTEIEMYNNHCTSIHTPAHLYRTLTNLLGEKSLVIGSIVHTAANQVTESGDGVGYGYIELAQANSGILAPISDSAAITRGLSEIGRLMARRLDLITERRLYKYNSAHTIQVRVNGVLAPPNSYVVNPSIPSIHLLNTESAGQALSVINILNCEAGVDPNGVTSP